jgi:preprotein translocase subunit SecE
MARPTRQDRRARRAQQPALAGGPPARPPARPVARGDAEPERRRQPERRPQQEERHVPGSGALRFIQESIGELKKVEWPNQKQVISGTAVVVIACVIVGTFLWLNDELWRYVVRHVLLR